MQVTFLGVRGSTPCPGEATAHFGGNTSAVCVRTADGPPIVLDLGTGLRRIANGPMRAVALVTHLHFDHVQGLPFCPAVLSPGSEIDIYGPPQETGSLEAAFRAFFRPPLFPVTIDMLPTTFRFHEVWDETFELAGGVRVTTAPVPHPGPTNGYRIEADGVSAAYVPDHQQPIATPDWVAPSVLELAETVDLLIHDAQYTPEELRRKSDWGHCTADYALEVARQAAAARLALFHHDPAHADGFIETVARGVAAKAAVDVGPEVFAAREGAEIQLTAGIPEIVLTEVDAVSLA